MRSALLNMKSVCRIHHRIQAAFPQAGAASGTVTAGLGMSSCFNRCDLPVVLAAHGLHVLG